MRIGKSEPPASRSGQEICTLKEIGSVMDLTRERVRQIEAIALLKLQKQLSLRKIRSINQIL